ncbi:MAG: phage major tail tube protein [Rhodospirillales bacterium]|nr:phage major tail tube protein [Rhodospirillales bacterium]
MLPKTLKNFTVFVDGVGYAGRIEEGAPPKTTLDTQEFAGGGMAGTVDIPMGTVAKMEFEFTLAEMNPDVIGKLGQADVPITFRGAQGTENEAVIIETRSLIREPDLGTWKRGDKNTLKIAATASYYKLSIAGSDVIEVDVEAMKFVVRGVDQLAAVRTALGL